jgi:hypothetical protein
VLQVFGFAYPADSSIRFTGSDKCVYRLHLELDPASAPPLEGKSEAEPNNTIAQANPVAVPSTNLGCINISGDEDCFSFSAKKGEKLKLEVQTAALGFPLDSWLKILDATGKQLVRDDDSETADPSIDWTAPEDGKFIAVVGNLLHRGGTNYLYRFLIDHPAPSYAPTVAEHAFTVTAGKTNQVKVSIRRMYGHTGKIKARITDLPDTVQCEADETGETASDLTLRLTAAADAKPFGGPVRVILTEPDGKERPALYRLVSKGEDNGVPQGYSRLLIESTENLWLTVLPAK